MFMRQPVPVHHDAHREPVAPTLSTSSSRSFRILPWVIILGTVLTILAPQILPAQDRVWTGNGASANWDTPDNWDSGVVPGPQDRAVFNAISGTKNATINVALNMAGIALQAGYTGTVTQGAGNTINISGSGLSITSGVFDGSNADITISGPVTLTGGQFKAPNATVTVFGNWSVTAANQFDPRQGTVVMDHNAVATISGPAVFYNLTIEKLGQGSVTVSDDLVVLNNLDLSRKSFTLTGTHTLEVRGNVTVGTQGNIAFTSANSTILLSGSGNQTIDFGNDPIYNLTVANTGGTVSFTRAFTTGTGSTATFLPGSSVAFPTSGTTTFSNIAWYGTAAQPITLASTTAGTTATIQVQQTAPRVSYVQVKDVTVAGNAITVFAGTDNGNNSNWVFSTASLVTLTQSDGTTAVTEGGATDTVTLVLGAQPTADVTVTLNGGTQLSTDVASVVFTPANWNVPQTLTVQAIDDAVFEWNHTGTLHHTLTSTDGLYNNFVVADLTVSITDNDQPVLSITSPTAGEQVHGQINVAVQLTSTVAGQARLVVDTTAGALQAVGQTDFTLPWDTTTVADGDHAIKVEFVPDGFPALTFATATVTVHVIQDAVPPVFSNFAPANNAFTNVAKTTISANYSDAGSGVNTTTLAVTLDGNPIAVTANATGFTYTSADDLTDGAHAVHATVQDNAGNTATADWSFTVDTVDPTVTDFEPSFFSTLTVKRPAISMTLADLTSGIKTSSIVFKLDDVIETATITATSVAFTPPADLSDGDHRYFVHVEDNAGNVTEVSAPFTVDTTPPDAPTITYTFESTTEVVAAGPVPVGQGIAELTVAVTTADTVPADVTSSVVLNGSSFLVAFTKVNAEVTTFAAEFRFKDDVGNLSTVTTASFAFNTIVSPGNPGPGNPGGLPPAAPQVSNLVIADSSLTGDKTGMIGDLAVSYTNKTTVHVTAQVSTSLGLIESVTFTGGTVDVTVAGNNAASGSFEADVDVANEGTFALSVSAVAKNGDLTITGSLPSDQQKILLVDRTAPTVNYTLPTRYSLTDDKDIVYLNGGQLTDNATLRSSRGINCYAPAEFVIAASVSDFTGLSSTVNVPAAKITGAATEALTVTVQAPADPGDSETITLSTPSATLPESVNMGTSGIWATGFNGAYLFQLKLTDKAGNALNAPAAPDYQNQFRIWVDRTAPDAIPGKLGTSQINVDENTSGQTQLSRAHWFVSTYDAAEAWQDTKDDAHRVLRSYKGAAPQLSGQTQVLPSSASDATNAQSAWLFNRNMEHPLVPSGGSVSPTIFLRDAAGNYSNAIQLSYGRIAIEETTPTSGHNEPATIPGEQGFIRETFASDKVQWHFDSSTITPEVDLKTSAGTNLEGIRSLLKTPSATIQVQAYYDYFDPGDEYNPNGAVYVVGPMDAGPANDPHVSPRVVTLPPSFQTTPVAQPARFKDNTIREVLELAGSAGLSTIPSVRVGLKSRDFAANSLSDLSLATAYATGSDTLYIPELPMDNAVPGWSRVTYTMSAEGYTGSGSYEQCAWTSGAGGGVDYGVNVIGLRPDVVVIGSIATLRFSAGFVSKDYTIDQLKADSLNTQFVHFIHSVTGNDVSAVQDPDKTIELNPTKITILRDEIGNLRQRLIIDEGQNETTVQTLEIDVSLGADVDPNLYHIDVKYGAIRNYSEPYGSPGVNGAHRMSAALDVVLFGPINKSFQRIPYGTAASSPHPTINIEPISTGDIIDVVPGIVLVPIQGFVIDPIADITEGDSANILKVKVGEDECFTIKEDDSSRTTNPMTPFAKKFAFKTKLLLPLKNGENRVTLAANNLAGNTGYGGVSIQVSADLNESVLPLKLSSSSYNATTPLILYVPTIFSNTTVDSLGIGLHSPTTSLPLETLTETQNDSLDFSGTTTELGNAKIVFQSNIVLNPQVKDTVVAQVTVPHLGLNNVQIAFVETGNDTQLFQISQSLFQIDITNIGEGTIGLAEIVNGTPGAYSSLDQVTPGVFVGNHPTLGQSTIKVNSYTSPDNSKVQYILVNVTVPSHSVNAEALVFVETEVNSNQYLEAGIGHSIGTPTNNLGVGGVLKQPFPFSITITDASVIEPTGEELNNPILFRYKDVMDMSASSIEVDGQDLSLIDDNSFPGTKITDRPLLVANHFPAGMVPNILNTIDHQIARALITTFDGRTVSAELSSVIVSNSPLQKVPRGVNYVAVWIKSSDFAKLKPFDFPANILDEQLNFSIVPIDNKKVEDKHVRIDHVTKVPPYNSETIIVYITIDSGHTSQLADPKKNDQIGFQIKWSDNRKDKVYDLPDIVDVVNLKYLVVGLGGGGYEAFLSSMSDPDKKSTIFADLFAKTSNSSTIADGKFNPGPIFNSVPTVDFVNWATLLTGVTPKDHGVLGNAFFPRDLVADGGYEARPIACANRNANSEPAGTGKLHYAKGVYDDKDNLRALDFGGLLPLLKDIGPSPGQNPWDSEMIHSSVIINSPFTGLTIAGVGKDKRCHFGEFVDKDTRNLLTTILQTGSDYNDPNIDPNKEYNFINLPVPPSNAVQIDQLHESNLELAKKLDITTAMSAKIQWEGNPNDVPDFHFLYFAGPDRAAHASNGDELLTALARQTSVIDAGIPGPIPNGGSMDRVISNHIATVTSTQFESLWKHITNLGWEQAVLVVVVSDHGLIRTPKDSAILTEKNVKSLDEAPALPEDQLLAKVLETRGITLGNGGYRLPVLWRGGNVNVNTVDLVYAPNGGLAHLYVIGQKQSNSGIVDSWSGSPIQGNLFAFARAFDAETRNLPGATYPAFKDSLMWFDPATHSLPGILMRNAGFVGSYMVYNSTTKGTVTLDVASAKLPATDSWIGSATLRIEDAMNDQNVNGSRSGDIVLLFDNSRGISTVNEADRAEGGSGSLSKTESEICEIWHYSGSNVAIPAPGRGIHSDLLAIVKQSVGFRTDISNFKDIVLQIAQTVKANQVSR